MYCEHHHMTYVAVFLCINNLTSDLVKLSLYLVTCTQIYLKGNIFFVRMQSDCCLLDLEESTLVFHMQMASIAYVSIDSNPHGYSPDLDSICFMDVQIMADEESYTIILLDFPYVEDRDKVAIQIQASKEIDEKQMRDTAVSELRRKRTYTVYIHSHLVVRTRI
ncbi:hypothetical protein ACJX0J_005774, partial [Zea mays]